MSQISAEALPPKRPDGVARVNADECEQEQPNIRLADALDEFSPGEVGEMNFVAGLVRKTRKGRQNYKSDENPAKGCTHSLARLTVATTECQERR